MNQKNSKKNLLADKRVILVISLILAALSWVIIAGFINPGRTVPIQYILIDYERYKALYEEKNLQIVNDITEVYADVQVQGDGSLIGQFNDKSINVYVDYEGVSGPGTWEVPLRTEKVASGTYSITGLSVQTDGHSLDKNPKKTVSLTFEEVERKSFTVVMRADGVTAAPGYVLDSAVPVDVQISGPKTQVDLIGQVVAEVHEEEALEERKKYTGVELTLLDKSGNELDKDNMGLTFSSETVDVDIPILEIRNIGLKVDFTGVPQYFDMEWFESRIHLSADELQVVGLASAFEHMDNPWTVASFDLSAMRLGWESDPVNVNLPDGLRNHDQLRQIKVSLDTTDMVEKTFEVPKRNFTYVNRPRNATMEAVADTISVKVIGPADQVEALLPENFNIQFDASGISATSSGQQMVPIRVLTPSANRVIAIESYSLVCDITVE